MYKEDKVRLYRKGELIKIAGIIAAEVVVTGKSSMWAGDVEESQAVAAILAPFNIIYADDFNGTWEERAR